MHEFSLIKDLMKKIDTISKQQKASRVASVTVKLGALSHISADHFREHFEHEAKGGIADGAQLDVQVMTDVNDPNAQEILLESIEVED